MTNMIEIGDKIELIEMKYNHTEINYRKHYLSRVMDYLEEGKLMISAPFEGGRIIPLEIGEMYQLCFYTKKGLFECKGEILDRYKEEKLHIVVIQFLSDLEKYQRREYYRLKFVQDFEYRRYETEKEVLEMDTMSIDIPAEWHQATLSDISGGGLRFISQNNHEKDEKILIKISLTLQDALYNFDLGAKIISSMELTNQPNYYQTRVEFFQIDTRQRETIIKFIFEQERKIRRREKGLD